MWTLILFKNSSHPVSQPFAIKSRQMETGLSLSGRVARMRTCVAWSMPDGSDILAVEHVFHSCLIEARHREGTRSIGGGEAKNRAIRGGVGLVPDKRGLVLRSPRRVRHPRTPMTHVIDFPVRSARRPFLSTGCSDVSRSLQVST